MAAEQPDYTIAVFGNDLLFDHIAEYLGIPDLKILRQTCKLVYSKVNGSRKFIFNLRLTISDRTIQENGMCESITYKNVSIEINRTSSQHFQNIRTECIKDLELLYPTFVELTELANDNPNNPISPSTRYELLEVKQFPHLRLMTLDLNLMCYDIPVAAMASVARTVKEFRFHVTGWCDYKFEPKGEEGRIAEKNLEMLGELPWKLHSFVFEGCRLSIGISDAMGAIPASSASTLQELKLCSVRFEPETSLHGVRFPQLKCIGLELAISNGYNGMPLAEFMYLQPQLEAIEINFDDLYNRYARFAPSVLEAIRRTCSSGLHTLRLRGPGWLESFPEFESWAFIRDLTRLKIVTICGMCMWSSDIVVANILKYLPSGTQSLELDYFKFHILARPRIIAALTGFPNLVKLKLSSRIQFSERNDAILQAICGSLIKLRTLHFGAEKLSDFGLTGERGNYFNSGVSLRNLKGLQDLVMPMCYGITEDGILKAIQFLELRRLELTTTTLSKSAIVEIASRNPSLEYVSCYIGIGRDHQDFKEYIHGLFSSILAVNPRLTLIRSTDLSFKQPDEPNAICRPSYGVSANLANTTTWSDIRNTMKIIKSSKTKASDFQYTYTYYYNMPVIN